MSNPTFILAEALLVDPDTAMEMVGGREVFERMKADGWFKPRVDQRKLKRYATEDLKTAVARLKIDPLPEL